MPKEQEEFILTLKEIELKHAVVKYKVDLKRVDFGLHVLFKEEPPRVATILLLHNTPMFGDERPCEEGYKYELYYGEGTVLVHLGCVVPSGDEDLDKNKELVEKNKEGLVKMYDGIFDKYLKAVKAMDENWDELKKLDEKFASLFGREILQLE